MFAQNYFFFSPPAHLCAVTYMTKISLIVTLNGQFNSTQNRHDRLIERQKTRYTWIPFQEYEINQFQRIFLYFPSFIETIN